MAQQYNLCLDIGGTKILGAIFDEKQQPVYRLKKKTKAGGDKTDNVEQVIISVVDEMIKGFGIKKDQIHAISAGAPGVIDQKEGVVLFSPNLPWRDYDIRTPIEKRFGVPFFIGNDVNMGVYGEYCFGAAKGYRNVVGFFVGTGMGGGLILNGELFTGNLFKAGEYGHMVLDPEGPLCLNLRAVEVMGRDITVISHHDFCENVQIRSIISAENRPDTSSSTVRFRLKPYKVHLFSADTEERLYFGDQKPLG